MTLPRKRKLPITNAIRSIPRVRRPFPDERQPILFLSPRHKNDKTPPPSKRNPHLHNDLEIMNSVAKNRIATGQRRNATAMRFLTKQIRNGRTTTNPFLSSRQKNDTCGEQFCSNS
jgi:hypothetical protein